MKKHIYKDIEKSTADNIVLYHANCTDGFCSAWIAFNALNPEKTQFIPVSYGEPIPIERCYKHNVFILDFSFPRAQLIALETVTEYLIILDHHKTAEKELGDLPFAVFDIRRSGAGLTWDYFYPDRNPPALVYYVEDYDLWRFELPGSAEINAVLQTYDRSFAAFDLLHESLRDPKIKNQFITIGASLLKQKKQMARSLYKDGVLEVVLPGYNQRVAMINCIYPLVSITGDCYLKDHVSAEMVILWSLTTERDIALSFRSIPAFDCSAVAKRLGGGGHAGAAGAKMSLCDFSKLLDTGRAKYFIQPE